MPSRPLLLTLCCCIALCAPPAGQRAMAADNETLLRPTISAEEKAAGELMTAIEEEATRARALPVGQRLAREAQLGRSLERLLVKAKDTKYENKALYWLAAWRISYAGGEGAVDLLERLDRAGHPTFKQAGRYLLIQVYLAEGRTADARRMADALAVQVPEFASARDMVAFHERVGGKAPRTAGRNLLGGPEDPAAAHAEPWMLYLFVGSLSADEQLRLRQYLDELSRPEYAGLARLVCVTSSSNPLVAAGTVRALAADEASLAVLDLLWANPNAEGDAVEWQRAWGLPALPCAVLLGPDRTIMAVQPSPTDLRPLVAKPGAKPDARSAPTTPAKGRAGRPGWQK